MRLYLSSAGLGDHPERLVELLRGGRRAAVSANALDRSPEFRGEALAEELAGLGRLRRALAASGADEMIADLVRADRIVYGGNSAGACVLAPSLRGLETVDEPGDDPAMTASG